jgi:hypothetical protein
MMGVKRESFTDGLSTVERVVVEVKRRMSVADQRKAQRAITELWRAWGFEHTIGACERYWQTVPADANATPLSLAWYRETILQDIAMVRRIVALRESPDPLPHKNLEFWIVSAMRLGRLTEEAAWRLGLGEEARLGLKTRAKNRAAAKRRGSDIHDAAAAEHQHIIAAIRRYRQLDPEASARKVAAALAARHPDQRGWSDSTIRGIIKAHRLV